MRQKEAMSSLRISESLSLALRFPLEYARDVKMSLSNRMCKKVKRVANSLIYRGLIILYLF